MHLLRHCALTSIEHWHLCAFCIPKNYITIVSVPVVPGVKHSGGRVFLGAATIPVLCAVQFPFKKVHVYDIRLVG